MQTILVPPVIILGGFGEPYEGRGGVGPSYLVEFMVKDKGNPMDFLLRTAFFGKKQREISSLEKRGFDCSLHIMNRSVP